MSENSRKEKEWVAPEAVQDSSSRKIIAFRKEYCRTHPMNWYGELHTNNFRPIKKSSDVGGVLERLLRRKSVQRVQANYLEYHGKRGLGKTNQLQDS